MLYFQYCERESVLNPKINWEKNSRARIGRVAFTAEASNLWIVRYSCNPKTVSGTTCLDNNASEAEVITDTKKSRKVNHQIHWRPEQNAKDWIYLSATQKRILADKGYSIIMHQSALEECVVKVVIGNRVKKNCSQDNLRLERTRGNTPKYLWDHKNSDVSSMPRGNR